MRVLATFFHSLVVQKTSSVEDCPYDYVGTIVYDFDKRVNPFLHSFYTHVFKLLKSNVLLGIFPIHSIGQMRYYIVKDSNKIMSIHKTIEASKLTFDRFVQSDSYENFVELLCVKTCEFGVVEHTILVYCHSKVESHTVAHVQVHW